MESFFRILFQPTKERADVAAGLPVTCDAFRGQLDVCNWSAAPDTPPHIYYDVKYIYHDVSDMNDDVYIYQDVVYINHDVGYIYHYVR